MSVDMQASFSTQIGNNKVAVHYDHGPKHVHDSKSLDERINAIAPGIFIILLSTLMLVAGIGLTGCFAVFFPPIIPLTGLMGLAGIAGIVVGIALLVHDLKN